MSTIHQRFFSPQDMRQIRTAITGEGQPVRVMSALPNRKDGLQDVLIMAPGDNLFKSVDKTDVDSMATSLSRQGLQIREKLDDLGLRARVTSAQAEALEEQGYHVFDNSPRQFQPGLPQVRQQTPGQPWDMPRIDPVRMLKADKMHEAGVTGKGTVIAVLDSGFDFPAYNDKLVAWKDVVNQSPTPHDGSGHGTHVVGDVLKTAPDAGIVAIKVMSDDGTGSPLDIINGLREVGRMKDRGINIQTVNMSLGGGPDGMPDALGPINIFVERLAKQGISVIAAAGNSGPDRHTIGNPADSPSAIAVGAALNETTVSDFSSRGPTDDGLERPDVLAPGEFIVSWGVPYSEMYKTAEAVEGLRQMSGGELKEFLQERPQLIEALQLPPDILSRPDAEVEQEVKPKLPPVYLTDDGQIAAPGTSFASPLTAGIVGALESVKDITPAETRELLRASADRMGEQPRLEQGSGFVNAEKALQQLKQV